MVDFHGKVKFITFPLEVYFVWSLLWSFINKMTLGQYVQQPNDDEMVLKVKWPPSDVT